jgi:AraC-like DNA-binding protein
VLPDGGTDIVVDHAPVADGRRAVTGRISIRVVGMMTRALPHASPVATEVLGVRFSPGGASAFFRVPARELTDRAIALEDLWGREAGTLAQRLAEAKSSRERVGAIEAMLLRHRKSMTSAAHCAWQAAGLVVAEAGQLRIGELVERTGFSRQYLARLFDEHVGIAPKLLARIERFSAIVERAEAGAAHGWADAAAAHGYYDQAHFIHEFTEFAGVTPTAYFARA